MSNDAVSTIGTKDVSRGGHRDAIHVAVISVVANEKLRAGQHVGLISPNVAGAKASKFVGIVDPFLNEFVYKGDSFWLCLYPRTITSLAHVWQHPDFDHGGSLAKEAMDWIDIFACEFGMTGEDMIDAAKNYLSHGDYLCRGSELEGQWVPDEFWDHYSAATGRVVKENDRGNFFTCSC